MSNRRFSIPAPNAPKVLSSPMQDAAAAILEALPHDWRFALMAFPPGKPLAYVSNGSREDVLRLLREFVAKQDAKPPDAPEGN